MPEYSLIECSPCNGKPDPAAELIARKGKIVTKLAGRIEICTNIAILIVTLLIGAVIVKNYVFASKSEGPPQIKAGTQIALPNVDWASNGQTLLLVLAEGCHFCSESAPFYQRLVQEAARPGHPRLVAVVPQAVPEGKKYLNSLGVNIDEVRQSPLASLGVAGTPTLILVNGKGAVTQSWIGKLTPDKESEVLSKLQCDSCS